MPSPVPPEGARPQDHGLTVERVRFAVGHDLCEGVLRLPPAVAPLPAVLLCAGFSGTQDTPAVRAVAAAFAHAGFAALTFDYRGFGLSSGRPRQVLDLTGQRDDITAAVDVLRADRRIDRQRIALWGTSLGGAHVVVVAAERSDVAAVVSQVPFNGFPRSVEGRSTRGTLRLLAAMAKDRVRGRLGLRPSYIPVVGPPGSLAVMATADAAHTIESLESETWRNEVAPRVLFDMMSYHPDRAASQVSVPMLVCLASHDAETPETSARRIADLAGDASLVSYPVTHFDIYRPGIREDVVADQVRFVTDALSREP